MNREETLERLSELAGIMADMPGDGADLVRAHINPEVLNEYARLCSEVLYRAYVPMFGEPFDPEETVRVIGTTWISAFTMGCAWGKMQAGSGEK